MDLFEAAQEALRPPPLRIRMDNIEFDGPSSLLEEGDLFLIGDFLGEVIEVGTDTVLFEWRQSPGNCRNSEQERLSTEAEGRIAFSRNSGHRFIAPEKLSDGDFFLFGELIWLAEESDPSFADWQMSMLMCRVISPTGDAAFEARRFPVSAIDRPVIVFKQVLAEHLLRAQYTAVSLPPPEDLFLRLRNAKGKTMSQCPPLTTPLKEIQGFPRKLIKALVGTPEKRPYNGYSDTGSRTAKKFPGQM